MFLSFLVARVFLTSTVPRKYKLILCIGGNYSKLHLETRMQLAGFPLSMTDRVKGTQTNTHKTKQGQRTCTSSLCISRNNSPLEKDSMTRRRIEPLGSIQLLRINLPLFSTVFRSNMMERRWKIKVN